MKILVVGCGAVGQVLGVSLQKANVELGFFDQPAVNAKLRLALEQGGLVVFQVTSSHRQEPISHRLMDYIVMNDLDDCRQFLPDQVWFTLPSQVYYTNWFREFLQKVPSKRAVCFIPEGRRPEFLPQDGQNDRFVFGGTAFMAWQGELEEGGNPAGGVHYWLPSLGIPLVGTKAACGEVKQILRKAGFRASIAGPDSHMQVAVTAAMTAFVAGLELAGWSLSGFRKSAWLNRAAWAAHEAVLGQLTHAGIFSPWLFGVLTSPIGFASITRLLPRLFPFDIQKYLVYHYTKTSQQSLALLSLFIGDGKKQRLPVVNLQMLLDGLQGI